MTAGLPLAGIRIIELAGIGPGPFCGMMLADHGAEVVRIDRPGGLQAGISIDSARDVMLRSRRTMSLDLKSPAAIGVVHKLAATADGFFEGFRPGVAERLGLGPDTLSAINPSLVYGRMTGWGQDGPYANLPGHDINYIAISGVLDSIGRAGEQPIVPLNLVGDFAGGGLMLAFGMIAAILGVKAGGPGRVIDCAMSEGAATLAAGIWSLKANGKWDDKRGSNLLDSGAPFYDTYETADHRYVAIGAIEEKFFDRLRALLGLAADPDFVDQYDRARWPAMRNKLAYRFAGKPLGDWCALFEDEDVCFAPVMPMDEAPNHPHNVARGAFLEIDGVVQPRPSPHISGTDSAPIRMWRRDKDTAGLLDELGFDERDQKRLRAEGAFGPP